MKELTVYDKIVLEEVWYEKFGKRLPPMFLEFFGSKPNIVFTHYEPVKDLIGPLNQYVDKDSKLYRVFKPIIGNCIATQVSSKIACE